jgi:hypothetical protein
MLRECETNTNQSSKEEADGTLTYEQISNDEHRNEFLIRITKVENFKPDSIWSGEETRMKGKPIVSRKDISTRYSDAIHEFQPDFENIVQL